MKTSPTENDNDADGSGRAEPDPSETIRNVELESLNAITSRIIACAIDVHRVLRCGLYESVYPIRTVDRVQLGGPVGRARVTSASDL